VLEIGLESASGQPAAPTWPSTTTGPQPSVFFLCLPNQAIGLKPETLRRVSTTPP
jgi:hypothetical protein